MEDSLYITLAERVEFISILTIAIGVFCFIILLFITPAPYGRYHDLQSFSMFGKIPGRLGWIFMESPNLVVPMIVAIYFRSYTKFPPVNTVLLGMYGVHYVFRSLIYPFLQKNKPHTGLSVLAAFAFCSSNAYIQACSLMIVHKYNAGWVYHWNFAIGSLLWAAGFFTNVYSDHLLRNLRKPGDTSYKIPTGFLFHYVSCANFFGEVMEWCGHALACWNIAALSFAVFSAGNLIPRAIKHHQYYKDKFDDYPKDRKAIIPFIL